jgi:hypothetical protein
VGGAFKALQFQLTGKLPASGPGLRLHELPSRRRWETPSRDGASDEGGSVRAFARACEGGDRTCRRATQVAIP